MKTVQKNIKLQLKPVATEKDVIVTELVQEELDDRDGLLEYLQNYHTPRGYEVTDFTILD